MNPDGKEKILVVDDEEILRYLIATKLQEEGYEVDSAKNGLECLEKLPIFNPDLIILDINMPLMDGITTVKEIRKLKAFCKVPVIFLTGVGSTDSLKEGFEAGGDEYLNKPINPDELMIRIKALLRMHRAEVEADRLSRNFHYLLVQDFLNYSTAVKLPLTLLADESLGKLNDQQKEIINIAIKALDENIQLLQETAAFTKFDPKNISVNMTQTNFINLLEDAVRNITFQLRNKNLTLINKIKDSNIFLNLDKDHIKQSLFYLFSYIIQKAPPGSEIQVGLSVSEANNQTGKEMEFFIRTDGEPLNEEEIHLLMDRYEQARSNQISLEKNLSLTLCKLIIEAHNGRLWFENKEGGNYYKFSIPFNAKN